MWESPDRNPNHRAGIKYRAVAVRFEGQAQLL